MTTYHIKFNINYLQDLGKHHEEEEGEGRKSEKEKERGYYYNSKTFVID